MQFIKLKTITRALSIILTLQLLKATQDNTAYNISYNEKISYVGGCAVVVLTATMRENRYGVRKTYRQNIKCPRVNEYWTCADGRQDFYDRIKIIQKREGK